MKKDICVFDHLRFFLIATVAPFFLLFFLTRLGNFSSFLVMGLFGMAISVTLLALIYHAWGYDALVRHRLGTRELLLGFLPCVGSYIFFNTAAWFLTFIVKFHWNFNTVYTVSSAFPSMALLLGFARVDAEFFSEERVIPISATVLFSIFCVVYCLVLCVSAFVFYRFGVRVNEKEESMAARGEKIIKKSFTKKIIFVPILNLVPFLLWILRHTIHVEAKLREMIAPLAVIFISSLGYSILLRMADAYFQSIFLYFALRVLGLYFLGVFASYVEILDEKKYEFLD